MKYLLLISCFPAPRLLFHALNVWRVGDGIKTTYRNNGSIAMAIMLHRQQSSCWRNAVAPWRDRGGFLTRERARAVWLGEWRRRALYAHLGVR